MRSVLTVGELRFVEPLKGRGGNLLFVQPIMMRLTPCTIAQAVSHMRFQPRYLEFRPQLKSGECIVTSDLFAVSDERVIATESVGRDPIVPLTNPPIPQEASCGSQFLRKTSGKHVKGDIKSVGSVFPQNSWVSFLGGCPMAPTGFGASFKGVLAITVFPRLCPKREFLFWV